MLIIKWKLLHKCFNNFSQFSTLITTSLLANDFHMKWNLFGKHPQICRTFPSEWGSRSFRIFGQTPSVFRCGFCPRSYKYTFHISHKHLILAPLEPAMLFFLSIRWQRQQHPPVVVASMVSQPVTVKHKTTDLWLITGINLLKSVCCCKYF